MRYHYRGFGADAPTAAPEQAPTVVSPGQSYSGQALMLLSIAALPWIPVAGGAWLGDKMLDKHGKAWGASLGFAFTFFTLRYVAKKSDSRNF